MTYRLFNILSLMYTSPILCPKDESICYLSFKEFPLLTAGHRAYGSSVPKYIFEVMPF